MAHFECVAQCASHTPGLIFQALPAQPLSLSGLSYKYLTNILQIFSKYLTNILQIFYKYLTNILQISYKYLTNITTNTKVKNKNTNTKYIVSHVQPLSLSGVSYTPRAKRIKDWSIPTIVAGKIDALSICAIPTSKV